MTLREVHWFHFSTICHVWRISTSAPVEGGCLHARPYACVLDLSAQHSQKLQSWIPALQLQKDASLYSHVKNLRDLRVRVALLAAPD